MKLTPKQRIEAYQYSKNSDIYAYSFMEDKDVLCKGICERLMNYTKYHLPELRGYVSAWSIKKYFDELELFEPTTCDGNSYWFNNEHERQIVLDFCIEMAKDAKE